MIDKFFLDSSVRIRKTYLNMTNNMDEYHKRAKDILNTLETTIKKIEDAQSNINKDKDISIGDLVKILKDMEEEGNQLENIINPMNKEIEKLSIEEAELYRKIVEKYPNLTEDQIVNSVRDRLTEEGLI